MQDVSGCGISFLRHSVDFDLEILVAEISSTFKFVNEVLFKVWGRLFALVFCSTVNEPFVNGA